MVRQQQQTLKAVTDGKLLTLSVLGQQLELAWNLKFSQKTIYNSLAFGE